MATPAGRGRGDPTRSLQDSVDRLAEAFERLAERTDAQVESMRQQAPEALDDRDRFIRHIRRYVPFYALATVWAIMLALLPTRQPGDTNAASQLTGGPQAQSTLEGGGFDTGELGTDDGGLGGGGGAGGGSAGSGGSLGSLADLGLPPGLDELPKVGKTRGGFDCNDGDVRQLPWSLYAPPCRPKFTGNNGGATSRGVTAKEILIVEREFPDSANSEAVDAFVEQAGFASEDVVEAAREKFIDYFNKTFELWGRKVVWQKWESQFGDSTAEAQSQGKEGACRDADVLAKDVKPFAIINGGGSPFAECAGERGLIHFNGGAYFPETWYRKYHPYLWNGVMGCERISHQVAEYVGKRLGRKPAKYAKSIPLAGAPRKYGTYVPNNDQYQNCVDIFEADAKEIYGMDLKKDDERYNYTLDVSRFPDEAATAIVQFNAANVTTVVLACDPISPIFLTQSATKQNYFPEWLNIGVATNDVDQWPRLWDRTAIENALFGMSQLSSNEKLLGPKSEPAITYKRATGTNLPENTTGDYWAVMRIFSALQAAGPVLTPQNMDAGWHALPPGGAPKFEVGYVSYQDGPDGTPGGLDHTGIDDSREIYWMADEEGPDGSTGTYLETYNGKRFRNGEWPKGDPPVYPNLN